MTEFHLELKSKRHSRMMGEQQLAKLLNVSVSSYVDLEHHSDEWATAIEFYKLRFLSNFFELDLLSFTDPGKGTELNRNIAPSEIIRLTRMDARLSAEQFAERVGFEPVFTTLCEEAHDGILLFPLVVAERACGVLNIGFHSFIRYSVLADL